MYYSLKLFNIIAHIFGAQFHSVRGTIGLKILCDIDDCYEMWCNQLDNRVSENVGLLLKY